MNPDFPDAFDYLYLASCWDSQAKITVAINAIDAAGDDIAERANSTLPLTTKSGISIGQSRWCK